MEASHVAGLLKDQTGRVDDDRRPSGARMLGRGLARLLVIRSEEMLEIRRELAFPRDAKYRSCRRYVFPYYGPLRADLMHDISF